ncbi:unnamed protein product [Diamesa serratosioi]
MTRKSFNLFNKKPSKNVTNLKMDSTDTMDSTVAIEPNTPKDKGLWRDLTAYWIFGMCNNFGYVVMLTAAVRNYINLLLLNEFSSVEENSRSPGERPCNLISTGAILLADVIPSLCIKSISPFLPFYANIRVSLSCTLAALGFVMVAFAQTEWVALFGVAITSLASGLGEPTFLAYSAYFNKNTISTWSSGTGGAGIVGALCFTVLRSLGLNNQQTLLVMIAVPILELITFFGLLRKPLPLDQQIAELQKSNKSLTEAAYEPPLEGIRQKISYIKKLVIYILPLAFVYLFEYLVNQGLFELVYFPEIFLKGSEQYRWYQVTYQIGVFISRSSVNVVKIKHIWLMAVLQFGVMTFFFAEAILMFTPSIWIIFGIILFEGLLGGGAYVNTFYRITKEIPATRREYAMGVVTLSDSIGITLAGFIAMPTHNWICGMPGGARLQ